MKILTLCFYIAGPLTEAWRSLSDIDGDIKYFAADNMDQLSLGGRFLIVESTQYAFFGAGQIILNEGCVDAHGDKFFLLVILAKITTAISKGSGFG